MPEADRAGAVFTTGVGQRPEEISMALITTTLPQQAEGKIAEIYQEIESKFGFIPNAIQLDTINPNHMARHWQSIQETIAHETLSAKLFTLIRLLVSEATNCEYCVGLNAGILMQAHGMSAEEIERVKHSVKQAPLNDKERALLEFVMKGIGDSNSITAEDIEGLKQHGCSEREIFDAMAQGAYQVAGDIMLNAFKVEHDFH
jgi:uncharacterized peroxidase-related enzyme